MTRTTGIVHLRHPWILEELPEHRDQVVAVDVVSNLLALVAENGVMHSGHSTLGKIGQESMQLGSGVCRSRQTTSAKDGRFHSEVASVLLHQHVCGYFGSTEQTVFALVNAHRLVNPEFCVRVILEFPARFGLH